MCVPGILCGLVLRTSGIWDYSGCGSVRCQSTTFNNFPSSRNLGICMYLLFFESLSPPLRAVYVLVTSVLTGAGSEARNIVFGGASARDPGDFLE